MKMQHALDRNEFFIKYQLMYDAKTKEPHAIEALLRWHNPKLGEISPSEFIPVAEKNGLIHPISEWVLRRACMDFRDIATVLPNKEILMSINVSVVLLENDKFLQALKNALAEINIDSNFLIFEITETALMQKPANAIKLMDEFRKLGVRFALDDFGVGFSSIRYLKNLPISFLKIDQSFVEHINSNVNDVLLIKSVIELAHSLNIKTITEGVETEDQYRVLNEMGSDYIQGFYFAEPLYLHEVIQKMNMQD
jgi:EAL domain-containing protein (putative c-di-GMP-specific phosphodiesterase class I)